MKDRTIEQAFAAIFGYFPKVDKEPIPGRDDIEQDYLHNLDAACCAEQIDPELARDLREAGELFVEPPNPPCATTGDPS
jgi:hypothetical protein